MHTHCYGKVFATSPALGFFVRGELGFKVPQFNKSNTLQHLHSTDSLKHITQRSPWLLYAARHFGYANGNIIISECQFMQSFNVFNLLTARVLTVVTLSYTLMETKPLTK